MGPRAAEAWTLIHVEPHVPCLCFFIATTVTLATLAVTFCFGYSEFMPFKHCLFMIYAACHGSNTCFFWRLGAVACKCRRHAVCIGIALVALNIDLIRTMISPEKLVPFQNRLIFTSLAFVSLWCFLFAGKCGGASNDHPPQPYMCAFPGLVCWCPPSTSVCLAAGISACTYTHKCDASCFVDEVLLPGLEHV